MTGPEHPQESERTEALPDQERVPRIDANRVVVGIVGALAASAIIVLSIGRLAGFTDLGDTLDEAAWQWLALCVIGQVAVFLGYAGVFRSALAFEDGPEVGARFSLRVAFAGFGLTQLVAAGGAAGLAFAYWILRNLGIPRRSAAIRLIAMNTAVYLVFGSLGFLAAAVGLLDSSIPLGMSLAWLTGFPLIVAAAGWFTQPQRVDSWDRPAAGWLRRGLAVGVSAAAWVRRAATATDGREVLAWGAVYWVGDLVSLWAAIRALGVSVSPAAIVLAYATGYLAQSIPIPLVATGGVDAATTFTLTAVGVPLEAALLGVLAHRVFAFWLPIAPGLWSAVALARDTVLQPNPEPTA